MKVRYTPRAEGHLRGIEAYIRERNPAAARRVTSRIKEAIQLLGTFPEIGHAGTLSGTREIVVPGVPYVIVHRIDPEAVTILAVYHGAQLRPGQDPASDDS
jgi:toxin ParE1/3/4